MTDRVTTIVASAGVIGVPWWVSFANGWVALAVGLLSAAWLIIQITHRLRNWDERPKERSK